MPVASLRGARLARAAGVRCAVFIDEGLPLWHLLAFRSGLTRTTVVGVRSSNGRCSVARRFAALIPKPGEISPRELGFCRWARNCQRFLSTEYARSCSLLAVGGSLSSVSPIKS